MLHAFEWVEKFNDTNKDPTTRRHVEDQLKRHRYEQGQMVKLLLSIGDHADINWECSQDIAKCNDYLERMRHANA